MDPRFLFTAATYLEVKPLIEKVFRNKLRKLPFEMFSDGTNFLVLTGQGKVNSASSVAHSIYEMKPDLMVNLGVCGAARRNISIGKIFNINKIFEGDRYLLNEKNRTVLFSPIVDGFEKASITTMDHPVLTEEERSEVSTYADLSDMEASAFARTCSHFKVRHTVFKIVSDSPETKSLDEIRSNIINLRNVLCDFYIDELFPRLKTMVKI